MEFALYFNQIVRRKVIVMLTGQRTDTKLFTEPGIILLTCFM